MLTHKTDKPFKCDFCVQTFATFAAKEQHERTHTGERPFSCDHPGCGKSFATTTSLSTSRLVHLKPRMTMLIDPSSNAQKTPHRREAAQMPLLRRVVCRGKYPLIPGAEPSSLYTLTVETRQSSNLSKHKKSKHPTRMIRDS